ncbi:peptidoglycan DD-metalloendopeptidase family protein [Pseudarthrobacter sp. MM222]|uniref:peptidoglycan DD-metalloendopeptidase family protein n=1 Tax=Pseudarthrobacter sp. MM222 TaxID=3018929 RepID=UPI002220680E|nr:peptidoglycan DD-metalloendopeptidase family protein [Pseudarthrobacter sp. MM222]
MISAALALILAASLGTAAPVAFADELEDQQAALQEEAAKVQHSLEFVDARIAQAAGDLVLYQGQLPGAQQALLDAQGRVAGAVREVEALAARVDLAQQNKAKITQQLETDKQKIADTKKLIGQIATQAYKSGGVPSNLSLFFGSNNGSLTDTIDLADQAMRSQNAAMDKLSQQSATNTNAQARLEAVEAEIQDLKAKADAALAREQAARDEAEAKKAAVDKLIADTTRLDAELQAAKPGIQSQLAQVKAQQDAVAAEIVERDRKLREAWEAEQRRIAEAAAAAARAKGQAVQPYVAPAQGPPSAFGLRSPFSGTRITSGFGWRATPPGTVDFYGQGGYMHTGIDFGAACGTPVYAPAAGTVFSAGWANDGGGNNVKISHGVVQGNSLTTIFYHNSSVVVSRGQQVSQGQLIAYSGTTGNSTGCHSHFETWLNGRAVDPMNLL